MSNALASFMLVASNPLVNPAKNLIQYPRAVWQARKSRGHTTISTGEGQTE